MTAGELAAARVRGVDQIRIRSVVEIHGTVDMATGELVMTGRAVTPDVDHAGLRATARPNPAGPGTCRPVGARTAALRARSAADARRT
jgi:hypothetical protein